MKITLFGYGKMGKLIESLAIAKGHLIVEIFDQNNLPNLKLKNTDVIIDFSTPQSIYSNIEIALNLSIPIVIGTTGWYEELENFTSKTINNNGTVIYGSNFSIGVNLFYKVNAYLAKLIENFPEYKLNVLEVHHLQKLDAPSGTAISIAKQIVESNKNYEGFELVSNDINHLERGVKTVHIEAKREDGVIGFHEVKYSSLVDELKFSHNAISREGFALGAIYAAEYVQDKKGFFNYEDLFDISN